MMFCCCDSKDSNSYSVDSGKSARTDSAADAHIETGKGPLSSSKQNLVPEASLDKGTIASAQRERNAVTEQPIQSSNLRSVNQSQSQVHSAESPSPKEEKPVDISKIESQIIESEHFIVSENKPVEQPKFVSTVTVTSNSTSKGKEANSNNYSQLASVNTQLDSLEQAITEVESKSVWACKSAAPELALQLKALNTQVLEVTSSSGNTMADKNLQDVVSRLESVATRLESLAVGGGSGASVGADEVAPFVLAYDEILNGPAAEFFAKSDAIGGQVKEQADIVKELFAAQREFLFVASKSNQPDANTLMDILKPSATKLQAVQDYRENHRGGEFFNHLSTISESIGAFGWVTVSPAPSPYVKEMADAGVFYKNRIVKIKEKDPVHTAWGKAWTTTLNDLQAYVKVHHTTGVTWNPRGGDAKAVKPAGGAAPPPPPPPAGIPPPPPPPPADGVAAMSDEGDRSALFASINRGEGVTQGLRKVTDDMKTHKNPALRQGPAPFKPKVQPKPVPTPAAKPTVSPAKPPVFELQQGKKWIVEHQKNNQNLVISETEMRQTVYIFKCENSVINIKGKVNSIIIDSCKKTGLVCQDVLATVEFVNCQSVKGQVLGSVPTVSIDKTDGCMVYLSENSLGVDILTAKSSEMNILVPEGTEGDFKEFALPEQYKTNYNRSTGTISTVQTEI